MGEQNCDYTYCICGEATDVGRHRKANEDNCHHDITLNGMASVVCDGMGGHVGGATASKIAVETIFQVLNSIKFENPREAIERSIIAANDAILKYASEHPELKGMGSTCVLLLVRDGYVYIGHVGDSRAYLVRDRRIRQLTKDHSYVQMLVDMGRLKPEEAETHARKNEITNALGITNMQPPTISEPIEPEAGDCFVLCSDGLSGMISSTEIERTVSMQREMQLQPRAETLVQKANEAGGLDNITVELVEFAYSPLSTSPAKPLYMRPVVWIISAIVILAITITLFFITNNNSQNTDKDNDTTIYFTDTVDTEQDTLLHESPVKDLIRNESLGKVFIKPDNTIQIDVVCDVDNNMTILTVGPDGNGRILCDKFIYAPENIECSKDVTYTFTPANNKNSAKLNFIYSGRKLNSKTDHTITFVLEGRSNLIISFKLIPAAKTESKHDSTKSPNEAKQSSVKGNGTDAEPNETQKSNNGIAPAKPDSVPPEKENGHTGSNDSISSNKLHNV